ncbi:MAG: aromatic amino acid aminotransferase, partial [Beijerinckiaceae bacterium]|nr:aromatic amino acid aminotransferase [Beijerinckiaceae bacterium]
RIALIRSMLASRLAVRWPALAAMSDQEGLFSILPLDEAQIMTARSNHGIYMSLCGRINIAGLRMADVDRVAADIVRL